MGQRDFKFKKKYGQNFLIDQGIIEKIINNADITQNTLVIEVGPGAGALTSKLASRAKNVVAYEIDLSLKEELNKITDEYSNVEIIYQDFLQADLKNDLEKYSFDQVYLIANLPYYITTPILEKILQENLRIDKMFIMVQKETGERLLSQNGTREYNAINVLLNYHFLLSKFLLVDRNCFFPVPNVDSVVLKLELRLEKEAINNYSFFLSLIEDAFRYKRKNLRNNLKRYDLSLIEKVLLQEGFSLSNRAEEIPVYLFVKIANTLK